LLEAGQVISEIAHTDLVIAEFSQPSYGTLYEIGVAHAMGKPTLFLIEAGALPPSSVFIPLVPCLSYNRTSEGITRLRQDLLSFFEDFRRSPRRFRSPLTPPGISPQAFVDLERLEPREFENLCFELLAQMGFRRVEWGRELRDVDIVATLTKRDPDGFDYQELWLVSMGLHAPIEMVLDMVIKDPDYLTDRLLRRLKYQEKPSAFFKPDTPITLLLIPFEDHLPSELIDRAYRRMERIRERPYPFTVRIRIWDRQQLTNLIQQYPQIAFKYFSEEGRAQSKYRKSPEELYEENIELTKRLLEEQDRRIKAERDAVWKDLSFTAAHKLGNPVFALETDLEGLKKRIEEGASDTSDLAAEMGRSLEKAKVIIEEFKSLTKAQEVSPRPFDILPLIENACRTACEHGVKVDIRGLDTPPQVMVDPTRITECFDELVANALHWFDKSEKKITVTVNMAKREELPEGLNQTREYLRVYFEDNGSGVPLDMKERIFAPFYTNYPHGTGLGLSLVQRIIEGHGGLIREIGEPGEGAKFEIFLPVASKQARESK
jgi:signal transduction histidine kinase